MRIYLDTEFNDYKGELISMALVAKDGREWYGVRDCLSPTEWVGKHVIPVLNQAPESDEVLRASLHEFLCSFPDVHIMCDWPGDIAHFAHFLEYAPGERIGPDVMTFEVRRDLPDTSSKSKVPHNALEDARSMLIARFAELEKELENWPIKYEEGDATTR